MQQIYYTKTGDQNHNITIHTDGQLVYCFIDKWLVYINCDSGQCFETLDYSWYVGMIDHIYEESIKGGIN